MIVVRWNRIARPSREFLTGQITALRREIDLLGNGVAAKIGPLLDSAIDLLTPQRALNRIADFLFWSRGKEICGWGYVHEAEVRMAAFLGADTVRARLETAERKLRATADAEFLPLADTVKASLVATYPNDSAALARLRAILAEALSANYDREDTSFAELLSWQNKTAWLVAVGLSLIVILTAWDPAHSVFFLIGALGGLLSRLSRSLERKDVPTDYGASWTTLFLSPVAGALGAWAGIVLCSLAVKLSVLGAIFDDLLVLPPSDVALAVALLFGFSERMLDEILSGVEDKINQSRSGRSTVGGGSAGASSGSGVTHGIGARAGGVVPGGAGSGAGAAAAGYFADGTGMANVQAVLDPTVATKNPVELSLDERVALTVKRLESEPDSFSLAMFGVGMIDKQRAIREVLARSEVGLQIIEIEERVISELLKRADHRQ